MFSSSTNPMQITNPLTVNIESGQTWARNIKSWWGHQIKKGEESSSQLVELTAHVNTINNVKSLKTNCIEKTESHPSLQSENLKKNSFNEQIIHLSSQNIEVSKPTMRGTRYEDISTPDKGELRQKIIEENFHYASYMYNGVREGRKGAEEALLLISSPTNPNIFLYFGTYSLSEQETNLLNNIINSLITLGFQCDECGIFYHLETGILFNLVYDHKRQEINVCLMGLDSAHRINITEQQQAELNYAALKACVSNVTGNLPIAAKQAMELGALLKETTKETEIQVVMVGHSHGGALAQAAAIRNGLKGVVFNAEPLGTKVKIAIDQQIGKEKRKIFSNQITAFSVKGDWLTSGTINALCRFGRDNGMPVPSVLGKGYQLPEVAGNMADKHFSFYDAFTKLANEANK